MFSSVGFIALKINEKHERLFYKKIKKNICQTLYISLYALAAGHIV